MATNEQRLRMFDYTLDKMYNIIHKWFGAAAMYNMLLFICACIRNEIDSGGWGVYESNTVV